ncbi:MAG: beta strand repeat-containing protein [Verrucomicrobiota bacterium]
MTASLPFSARSPRLALAALLGVWCASGVILGRAATIVWENTGTAFSTGGNWVGGTAPANDLTTDIGSFQAATPSFHPQLTGNRSISGLEFTSGTGAWTFTGNSGTRVLTIGAGGIVSNGDSTQTFSSNLGIAIGANTAFTSNGTGALNFTTNLGSFNIGTAFTLTLNGSSTAANTIAEVIADSSNNGRVTKSGSGTWVLSGNNTYGGATTISEGVLSVSNLANGGTASNIGNSSNAAANLVFDGGTLRHTLNGLDSTNRNFTITAGKTATIDISDAAGNLTISGAAAASTGGLTKIGAGTLTLSGSNAYTGATTIGSLNGVSGGTLTLGNNERIANSSSVTVYAGTFNVNSRTETISELHLGGGASGTTAAVTMTSGTLNLGGNLAYDATNNPDGATISGGTLGLGANRTFTIGDSTATTSDLAISSVISGTSFGISKQGAGTLVLSGANSYTGATTLSAGTLSISDVANGGVASHLGQSTNAAANLVFDGGTLSFTGATDSTDRNFTINTGKTATIEVANAAANLTISGASTSTNGALTKTGDGKLTLTGASSYTGATTVSAGVLNIQHATAAGTTAGGIAVAGGAALELQGGIAVGPEALTLNGTGVASGGALRNVSGANSYAGAITLGSTGVRLNSDADTLTLTGGVSGTNTDLAIGGAGNTTISTAGIATGTGSLTKDGSGTLTISADGSYTGATTLSAGTLSISDVANGGVASHLGQSTNAAANLVFDGGTLSFTGATDSTDRNFTINTGKTATIEVANAAANLTISGASTSTNGALTKTGDGTLTLSGNNLYTGTTTVSAGTLHAAGSGSLGATSGAVTVASGATLSLAGGNAITLTNPTNAETIDKSGMLTLAGSGVSASTGALHAAGATGQTSQWLGNITLSGNATISAADNLLRIGDGALYNDTISLGGNTLTLHTTSTTGVVPVNLADTTMPYDQFDATNILVNTTISGTGGLRKTGAGTATIVSFPSNSFSGATEVAGGKLIIDGGGNAPIISSTSVTIGNSSSPGSADSVVLQMGQLAAGTASVNNMIGTSSASTATTSMTIYEDGLFSMNGGSNSLVNLTLRGGHVNGGNPSYGALLTITGQITTTAAAQTAVIDGGYLGMSSNTFAFNIADGAAATDLRVDSIVQNGVGFTGGNSATSLSKTGAGTLLLTATNTYAGVTNITGGVLAIRNSAALGQGSATSANGTVVGPGAQLQLDGSNGALTIANESLTLSGDGTSTTGELRNTAGSNTYNGFITLAGNSRINADSGSSLTIANTAGAGASILNGNAAGRELSLGGAGNIAINSVLGSNVGTIIKDGTGTATLAGDYSANTVTTVKEGTLNLNMGGGGLSSATTVAIGDGVGPADSATLLLSQSNQIANNAAVTLGSDGRLNLSNNVETVGSIAGSGKIIFGTGQLTVGGNDSSTSFSGTLAGASSAILNKAGTGTLTIDSNVNAAAGDFAGTINVNAGTLAFNVDNAFNGTVNVFAGTTFKLSDADLSIANLNFVGAGNITLDFSGASTLSVTNLTIAAGITVNIINWNDAIDYFFAQNWSGAVFETRGQAPMNQVVFASFTGNDTKWQSYDNQITPVPEPSAYGALLVGALGALLGFRRWRKAKSAAPKQAGA